MKHNVTPEDCDRLQGIVKDAIASAFVLCGDAGFVLIPFGTSEQTVTAKMAECVARGLRPAGVVGLTAEGVVSGSLDDIMSVAAVAQAKQVFAAEMTGPVN
jgi:hypothetical protein